MQPVVDTATAEMPLAKALNKMRQQDLESLPVIAAPDDRHLVGLLELRATGRAISQEILRRRRLADGAAAQSNS